MSTRFVLAAVLALASPPFALAQQPTPTATKEVAPTGAGRILQHSAVINAPSEVLYTGFTNAEGIKKHWGVALAEVDFRIGGLIRTNYNPKGVLGDGGTIGNTILAFEPGRMVTIKPIAPANAPESIKLLCTTGWNVIRFEPLAPSRTRITISGMGFGTGGLWDEAYSIFDKGNAQTLEHIRKLYATAEAEQKVNETQKALRALIGDWEFSKARPDGATFRGTTTVTESFDGRLLIAIGHLGDEKALHQHSHTLFARDPASGTIKVRNINEMGDYTEGEARVLVPGKIELDWFTTAAANAQIINYRVVYTFDGPDAFRCEVFYPTPEGPESQIVDVLYQRIKANTSH